jgi:hypothetical protein
MVERPGFFRYGGRYYRVFSLWLFGDSRYFSYGLKQQEALDPLEESHAHFGS